MSTIMEPATVTEADVLERAADILEEWGHCKGNFFQDAEGQQGTHWRVDDSRITSYCAFGAIWRAAFDFGLAGGSVEDLMDEMLKRDGDHYFEPIWKASGTTPDEMHIVVIYNDGECTTSEGVTTFLRLKASQKRQATQQRRDGLDDRHGIKAI